MSKDWKQNYQFLPLINFKTNIFNVLNKKEKYTERDEMGKNIHTGVLIFSKRQY